MVGLSVVLFFALADPLPAMVPLVVFASLHLFAEHHEVVLPTGQSLSAGFMLVMASVVVFAHESSPLGPVLVGMSTALYLPHLRSFEWRKISFNLGDSGLAALAAALVYHSVPHQFTESPGGALLIAVPAALACATVNLVLLSMVIAMAYDRPLRGVFREYLDSYVQIVPFALLGVFLGLLYRDVGAAVVPLFVVPILIARQTFGASLDLRGAHEATVRTLIRALEAKDAYTAGHAERVARYAQYAGEELRFPPRRLERLRFAALMHDVGKLVVPNHLLNKPGRLTPEEFERVRSHEAVAVEILGRIDFLRPVTPSASGRFSRYEPGDDTNPVEPYIVSVADAYDAMTSTRAYRKALSQDVAFAELRDKAGTQFHPQCVEALIAAVERRGEHHGAGWEAEVHEFEVAPPEAGTGSAGLGDLDLDAGRKAASR